MFKKGISLLLALLLVVGMLAGCAQKAPEQAEKQEPTEKPLKIAMVTDVGGVHDKSFNESAWEGLQRAEKELGIKAGYQESKQEADYADNLELLVDQGNDLVWGIGFLMGKQVKEAAENYPDQKFAIIDNAYKETPKNLMGVLFKEQEAAFLVGYIAGKMTKTNKVGFIGGMDFDVIHRFHYGYKAGVKYANPDCEVFEQYAGAFDKPAIGRSIAESMYGNGADIIFHAAGDTGNGMIEVAKEKNKYAIGVDKDQNKDAPENVITSAVKRVDNAIFNVAKDLKEGKWQGGSTVVYGLAEGGVDIAPSSNKLVPKEILDEVEQLKKKIVSGEIKIPQSKEEYESMMK
ncbi:BMP family ABC transporter substrate-binding protein [Crassaminicella thermophila]|uniref:BMP family ABC transporter substrate-binding protein n=1 Tax=Crassaminicella thermophila TaxID=2599308 RepID=A0A5C0SD48_CRATE|nr:BMP family ABC transporter substrate-binding protein [Crassaminicella thermophila]QEK11852.1 BMP family ABC transporter substrate-binding protein [Crassaminicella thermophila]